MLTVSFCLVIEQVSKYIHHSIVSFCRDICVGENHGVREHDDCKVQLGEAEWGTIGWCHTHTSCAFFFDNKNKKLEICSFICFSLLSHGKMKVIASIFLCFRGVSQLREKGCECKWEESCEHNDFNAKISKENRLKCKWVKLSRNGFSCQTVIYPVWPICSQEKHNWCQLFNHSHNVCALPNVICFAFQWQKSNGKWDSKILIYLAKIFRGWTKQSNKKMFKTERSHRTK